MVKGFIYIYIEREREVSTEKLPSERERGVCLLKFLLI